MTLAPEHIGMAAGFLTTMSFIPQALDIWRSKCAKGVSAPMYCTLLLGFVLWFAYGMLIESFPVMLYNSVSFCFAALILAMKLAFKSP